MDKVKELERRIQAYRDGAALYRTVSEVVRAWDGKCYTKRFSDALRAATGGRVYSEKRYKRIEVHCHTKDGVSVCLCVADIEKTLKDGKRIQADAFIDKLREKREELLRRAADSERGLAQAAALKPQLETLIKAIKGIQDSVPYEVLEATGLYCRIQRRF